MRAGFLPAFQVGLGRVLLRTLRRLARLLPRLCRCRSPASRRADLPCRDCWPSRCAPRSRQLERIGEPGAARGSPPRPRRRCRPTPAAAAAFSGLPGEKPWRRASSLTASSAWSAMAVESARSAAPTNAAALAFRSIGALAEQFGFHLGRGQRRGDAGADRDADRPEHQRLLVEQSALRRSLASRRTDRLRSGDRAAEFARAVEEASGAAVAAPWNAPMSPAAKSGGAVAHVRRACRRHRRKSVRRPGRQKCHRPPHRGRGPARSVSPDPRRDQPFCHR